MKRLAPLLAALCAASVAPAAIPPIPAPAQNIITFPQLSGQLQRQRGPLRIIGRNHGDGYTGGTAGTDFSATGRSVFTTGGAISTLQICNGQRGGGTAGSEVGTTAPEIVRATVELQGGQLYYATKGGTTVNNGISSANYGKDMIIPGVNVGPQSCFDPMGVYIPANTQFWIREFKRVPQYPLSPAAAVTTSTLGNLAASTTYYYKFTTMDTGLESGPTAEVTCTTGATLTLACNLTWTKNFYAAATNIYRGTSTGTETFLTQVASPQANFTDVGTIAAGTATPPGQTAITLDRYPRVLESANTQYGGGNGSDQTNTTGAITGTTGNSNIYIPTPSILLGDDTSIPTIYCMGDSIEFGTGIVNQFGQNGFWFSNWCDLGWTDGTFNSNNYSIGGTSISGILGGSQLAWGRLLQSFQADYVVGNLGINDIATQTWQQIATNQQSLAQVMSTRGVRYIVTTLTPKVSTTDNMLTVANQTVGANESVRANYNNWVRNGMQFNGGSPCNTASCGTPSPYIWNWFDLSASVEVNSSNVLTPNGGFWVANLATTITGTASGTPTTTVIPCSTCNLPVASGSNTGLGGYVLKMTSGAANGQTANISLTTATQATLYATGSTAATGLAVTGLSTAPSAGDTFSIYPTVSFEGTHPSLTGHTSYLGPAWATWVAANITKFGPLQ